MDFDKTLIPFDSFKKYISIWIKLYPFRITLILILRKLKFLSSSDLKKIILKLIIKNKKFNIINENFSNYLINNITLKILEEVKKEISNDDILLLLSASPNEYISLVGDKLGLLAKGSYIENNKFIHLHDIGKINFLKLNYPEDKFYYYFALSDSYSDLEMLKLFEKYEIYKG